MTEERNMKKTRIAPQICAAFIGAIIVIEFGFHLAWASPTLPKLLADTSIPVTLNQSTWIVSLLMVGCVIGPLISVAIVDRWGRKISMLLLSIPFIISCIVIYFAQAYWWYYIGRFIAGLGAGAAYTMVPIYLGEIAEDRIRGSFGVLISITANLGYLLVYCAGPWVSTPVLAAIGLVFPILYLLTFSWMPETPYYYTMKEKPECARKTLEWLRGTTEVDEELLKVQKTVEFDLRNAGSFKQLFTDKGNAKALLIMFGLLSGQQVSGYMAIVAYSTVIFNEVVSEISSSVSVIINGVVHLIISVIIACIADKAGRRIFLIFSMFFSAIFLIGVAVYFHLKANGTDVSGISWLPVTAMVGYSCSYTLGLGTLPVAIISEIFSYNVKAYASMMCSMYLALATAAVSQFYPIVANAYGIHVAFYLFAIGTVFFMVLVFFYLPETNGKSLGEIRKMLQGQSSESKTRLHENYSFSYDGSNSISCIAAINVLPAEHGTIISKSSKLGSE